MNPLRLGRTAALIGIVITAGAVLYPVVIALTGWEPPGGSLLRALFNLGELAVVVALAASGAAGNGWLGRLGLGVAALGTVLFLVAELTFTSSGDLGDQLFVIAPPLTGVGLLLAGIAVLRTGRWSGWRRPMPLVLGLYLFLVLMPLIIVSGGPPAVPALWGIAGWDAGWLLIGCAVLAEIATSGARTRSGAAFAG